VVNCGQAQSYWVVRFHGLLGGSRSYSPFEKALAANHTKSTTYSNKKKAQCEHLLLQQFPTFNYSNPNASRVDKKKHDRGGKTRSTVFY
jgi:hypothetical protein